MKYEEWETVVPKEISNDSLWKMKAYRLSLYAADLGWFDAKRISENHFFEVSDQLLRSIGSISANLAEGYSRSTGKDRARFYEYALGSAREGRDWYFKAKYILGNAVVNHRNILITEIIRLLLTTVPQQRGYILRESQEEYITTEDFLANVPLP
ncbi:four helix bundle protein [bacterium]|nr:four helix bundle protein [bacterium]